MINYYLHNNKNIFSFTVSFYNTTRIDSRTLYMAALVVLVTKFTNQRAICMYQFNNNNYILLLSQLLNIVYGKMRRQLSELCSLSTYVNYTT